MWGGVCRWTAAFGGQPPLLEAAAAVGDPQLDGAIATISQVCHLVQPKLQTLRVYCALNRCTRFALL